MDDDKKYIAALERQLNAREQALEALSLLVLQMAALMRSDVERDTHKAFEMLDAASVFAVFSRRCPDDDDVWNLENKARRLARHHRRTTHT